MAKINSWKNRSPGDLSIELEEVHSTPVEPVIEACTHAAKDWSKRPLKDRIEILKKAQTKISAAKDELARGISLEMGKPITEALGEMGAVIAKFDLSFQDAEKYLSEIAISDGVNPSWIRRKARGPAVVVGPFNFPIHLAHGAIVPHLLAGNPVVFKPSPLAAVVAGNYSKIMAEALPQGVFNLVQGGGDEGWTLCTHPKIRSVSFTGSVPVGKKLAVALAEDLGKEAALELGGKNAVIVCADADLELASRAVAESSCLTAGQRCNSTSRVLVDHTVSKAFLEHLVTALKKFQPGDPLNPATTLGPVVNAAAVERYRNRLNDSSCEWIVPGKVLPEVGGKRGYYVMPAVAFWKSTAGALQSQTYCEEAFAPILSVVTFSGLDEAISLANNSHYGLTCSIFTRSKEHFLQMAEEINVGNIYLNLPTTGSPSTLPFGGWKDSGNRRPGGRGFIRFVTDEQAVQMKS